MCLLNIIMVSKNCKDGFIYCVSLVIINEVWFNVMVNNISGMIVIGVVMIYKKKGVLVDIIGLLLLKRKINSEIGNVYNVLIVIDVIIL